MKTILLTCFALLVSVPAFAEDAKTVPPANKPVCGKTIAECQTAWETSQASLKEFQSAYQLARQQRDQTAQAFADNQVQNAITANKGK